MKYTSAQIVERSGKWQGQLSYKDGAGKWRKVSRTLKARGKREAQRELEAWRDEMEDEALRESGEDPRETVAQYVKRYIDERGGSVERSTLRGYRSLLNNQIAPGIGSKPLDDLKPDDVSEWVSGLSAQYAPVVARKAFVLLKSAMAQAVARDRLLKDPTRTVKPPKLAKREPNALDARSRAVLASVLDVGNLSPAMLGVKIALCTGMREGEVCAVRWRDVDLDRRVIRVTEAIGTDGGEYYVKPPKTDEARDVHFPETLAESLSERLAEAEREGLAGGFGFSPAHFVIGAADGSFMPPHYLRRKWNALADALELGGTQGKSPTFHDLRHTYATAAIANGLDVKTVSSQLGHANAAMTLNIYASSDPDAKRRSADAMGRLLAQDAARARGGNVVPMHKTGTEGR